MSQKEININLWVAVTILGIFCLSLFIGMGFSDAKIRSILPTNSSFKCVEFYKEDVIMFNLTCTTGGWNICGNGGCSNTSRKNVSVLKELNASICCSEFRVNGDCWDNPLNVSKVVVTKDSSKCKLYQLEGD